MADKEMISSKMAARTANRLKEYAEKEGISKSQAVENMVKQGLDVEESDMRLVPVKTDGGTELEDKINSVENKIDKQDGEIGSVIDEIESRQKYRTRLDATLILAITWIGLQLGLSGLGPVFSAVTGIPLIGVIAYHFYKLKVES